MSKQSGIGARCLIGGYDLSTDFSALDSIKCDTGMLPGTDITQPAMSRIPGLRDGSMGFTVFFNPANSTPVLSALPVSAEQMMALLPPMAVGSSAACLNALQIGYDPSRGSDGSLMLKVGGQGTPNGLEWGTQLTPGVRTDTAATNGTSLNNGAATAYGAQAYLQLTAFTGTSVTVTVQHAPDNATWTALAAFTAQTAAPVTQRVNAGGAAFTATMASPAVFTAAGTAYVAGQPVQLTAPPGGLLPGGFTAATTYYVVSPSGTSFELAATSGGSAVNSSSAGSGTATPVVQQYVRVVTTGTFTSVSFAVAMNRNQAVTVF